MSKVEFKLDAAGFREEVLKADYMLNEVRKYASESFGSDHVAYISFDRAYARKSKKDDRKQNH